MIPSNSSPRFPSATATVHQQVPEQNQSGSSPSDYLKPSYGDDDDFYIIFQRCGLTDNNLLREDVVKKLSKDHPGIFDGLTNPSDLLRADPVRYQPLAKLLADNGSASIFENNHDYDRADLNRPSWNTEKISYGLYKHGFYEIMLDHEEEQYIESYPDRYEAMKKSKHHVSQLQAFLFDQSISDSEKVAKLQSLFPPTSGGGAGITADQLLENTELLFGDTSKETEQQAIEYGIKP